jgi:hypothetical protein
MPRPRVRKFLRRAAAAIGLFACAVIAALVFAVIHCRANPPVFPPTSAAAHSPPQAAGVANYARDEVDTFYSYPEWYIVWSYQSKADYQRTHLPSDYSWFGDIAQYWQAYCRMYSATRATYPFATGDHIMLLVIGSSFTAEYTLKGVYERTIGAISEASSDHQPVPDDMYAAQVAADYATFVHIRPFYEFSFAHALHGLWQDSHLTTHHLVRTIERRAWLTLDYAVEAFYCEVIEIGTHATYGYEDTTTAVWIDLPSAPLPKSAHVTRALPANQTIVELPRYQEFTPAALALIQSGARFHQIAGNEIISISVIAPQGWSNSIAGLETLIAQPMLTSPGTRVVLLCRVSSLDSALPALQRQRVSIEHIYDY